MGGLSALQPGCAFAKIAGLFAERLGLSVTAGALCQAAQSTSTDLVSVNNEIHRRVNNSPVVAVDETGWRIGGAPHGCGSPHSRRCCGTVCQAPISLDF